MAEEAKRIGEDARAHAMGVGHDYQKAMESGFEVASRSIGEVNRGLQAIAAEMTDFSKKRFEDIFQPWEQLLRARSFGDVVDAQARYAQRAYDAYTSEMSTFSERCMSARPIMPPSRSNEVELGHATSCRLQAPDVGRRRRRRHLHSESARRRVPILRRHATASAE